MSIEKPLFDIGTDDQATPESIPTEPCIPDFILHSEGTSARGARTVAVETMGFADPVYRSRKVIMHGVMSRLLDGAPVLVHDFHEPHGMPQEERDRRLWLAARWAITGPVAQAGGNLRPMADATNPQMRVGRNWAAGAPFGEFLRCRGDPEAG